MSEPTTEAGRALIARETGAPSLRLGSSWRGWNRAIRRIEDEARDRLRDAVEAAITEWGRLSETTEDGTLIGTIPADGDRMEAALRRALASLNDTPADGTGRKRRRPGAPALNGGADRGSASPREPEVPLARVAAPPLRAGTRSGTAGARARGAGR